MRNILNVDLTDSSCNGVENVMGVNTFEIAFSLPEQSHELQLTVKRVSGVVDTIDLVAVPVYFIQNIGTVYLTEGSGTVEVTLCGHTVAIEVEELTVDDDILIKKTASGFKATKVVKEEGVTETDIQELEEKLSENDKKIASVDEKVADVEEKTSSEYEELKSSFEDFQTATDAKFEELDGIIGVQKMLWDDSETGALYMNGSQTITLSEGISKQTHGIVLVFSYYNEGGQNESFSSHFVPKEIVALHNGCGHNFNLCGMFANGMKYLYISDTTIKGHANNSGTRTIGGISHNNSYYALRYVIGV